MHEAATWLSHHPGERHDRCVVVAGRPVCRRCAVLYAVAVLGAVVVAAVGPNDPAPLVVAMWLLPLPAAVDWTVEHLAAVAPSPRRLVAVTVPAGVALGIGIGLQLRDPWAPSTLAPLAVWAAALGLVAFAGARRRAHVADDWVEHHERAEAERAAALHARLAAADAQLGDG